MQKRAQLSVFILLGAILVIAVALLLEIRTPPPITAPLTAAWASPAVSALHGCVDSTTKDAITVQLAQGGELRPVNGVYLPPMVVHLAVDNNGVSVPSLDEMAADLDLNLPDLLAPCIAEARTVAPGVTIEDANATVTTTYNGDGAVVQVTLPAVIRAGANALQSPPQVVNVKDPQIALLAAAAEKLANDVYVSGGLPAEGIATMPYAVNVFNMGLGSSIISIRADNDVFNLGVREAAKAPPMVGLFLGPDVIEAVKGTTVRRMLELSRSPDGIDFSTNMAWATVGSDGWLTIRTKDVDPGSYAVGIHASGAVTEDTIVRVTVT